MNREERIKAALACRPVDRVPISAWMHFSAVDQDPVSLAEEEVAFTEKYDFDFIKMMPFGLYSVQDFGTQIRFYCTPYQEPTVIRPAVSAPEDYEKITAIPALQGTYGKQIEFARELAKRVPRHTPFIQTVFSPFSTLKKMTGDRLLEDIIRCPQSVHHALQAITATTVEFIKYHIDIGVSGFFFATQNASRDIMTPEQFREFGEAYDLQVIRSYQDQTWFNVLHIHGNNIYFEELSRYPVNCLNWHDRHTFPSLREARKITSKCLLAGIKSAPYFENGFLKYDDIVTEGNTEDILRHVREAIASAGEKGLIIGPGCVVDPHASAEHMSALRRAADRPHD
ncbi:MAG TPA: uroporphyrinogen decarboxylase [Veillonellaceae bacterium]|mgnify:CR=1 FL=1|nr:uroporphyrinogen decarboxylase [Veillonellaceae bacterium]